MPRKVTNQILEMIEDGVADMAHHNGFLYEEEPEDEV